MKRKQYITASELMAQLNADPEFIARKKERDDEFRRKHEENMRAEAPLVEELRQAGVPVSSVWDLVNLGNPYPQSLPILLNHLQHQYPAAVRDGIARAMAVRKAKFAWPVLVELYRQESANRTKGGLAVALSNVADEYDEATISEVIALAKDPQQGRSRVLLLDALRRSRLPQARRALLEFRKDPLLGKEARKVLRQLEQKKH